MAHKGVAPLDPETQIGKLRENIGDTEYVPLDPPEDGYGDYTSFSDSELNALLESSNGSIKGAVGYAYLKLAGVAAARSISLKTDDLSIDWTKRASDLRAIAQIWFDAAAEDDQTVGSDIFDIVPTAPAKNYYAPEATPFPMRRFGW